MQDHNKQPTAGLRQERGLIKQGWNTRTVGWTSGGMKERDKESHEFWRLSEGSALQTGAPRRAAAVFVATPNEPNRNEPTDCLKIDPPPSRRWPLLSSATVSTLTNC
ncbi:unnamed protein product [Caenorhabditis auriculariae]|uniref:Uncharacterized protein n=1 Tax=Caenorhabditis auriculariae TaxID=2777116 RepID=A0A8S1GQ34_9PELO|nr:unnamed protein product [Caenorhabditis auriculariae]